MNNNEWVDEINNLTIENRKLKNIFYSVKNYLRYVEDQMNQRGESYPEDIRCLYIKELIEACSDYIE